MPYLNRNFANAILSAGTLLLTVALTGCGTGLDPVSNDKVTPVAGAKFSGSVHGGQQPISGATIQFYAVGSTGYGSAYPYSSGTSLLGSNVVTTAADGSFDITNDYTCPTARTQVYLTATGGNPGLVGGTNPGIGVMAALGPCGSLGANSFVSVNEITTVASIWALSPFMTGIANIGSTSTNPAGLANAFAAVNKVVSIAGGTVSGPTLPAGATLPIAKINMLANILAACINSSGGTAGDNPATSCGILYSAATVNGVAPTNTIMAAMNIAQHPTANVATLTTMVSAAAPFQPSLTSPSPPNDLSIVISYTAGGLSTPRGIATDQAGNVWITNSAANTVTEIDNSGALLSASGGYTVGSLRTPAAIAIDQNGSAWIANTGNNTVSKITTLGGSGTAYTGGSLSAPSSLAVDAYQNIWVSNGGNSSVTKITQAGVLSNYSPTGVSTPVGIAMNPK